MRKQLRISDILYKHVNVIIPIRGINKIIVEERENVVTPHWLITTVFNNTQTFCQRIITGDANSIFVKELREYVKEVNRLLRKFDNGSNSQA